MTIARICSSHRLNETTTEDYPQLRHQQVSSDTSPLAKLVLPSAVEISLTPPKAQKEFKTVTSSVAWSGVANFSEHASSSDTSEAEAPKALVGLQAPSAVVPVPTILPAYELVRERRTSRESTRHEYDLNPSWRLSSQLSAVDALGEAPSIDAPTLSEQPVKKEVGQSPSPAGRSRSISEPTTSIRPPKSRKSIDCNSLAPWLGISYDLEQSFPGGPSPSPLPRRGRVSSWPTSSNQEDKENEAEQMIFGAINENYNVGLIKNFSISRAIAD